MGIPALGQETTVSFSCIPLHQNYFTTCVSIALVPCIMQFHVKINTVSTLSQNLFVFIPLLFNVFLEGHDTHVQREDIELEGLTLNEFVNQPANLSEATRDIETRHNGKHLKL